jgi:metallo-beta-lactamase family protein
MGKNKKNQIRVSFLGNNAENVAGSMTLITTQTKNILVECGLVQGNKTMLADYRANSAKFDFKPKDIDLVIIGHCHADHGNLLPRLYKEGCTAPIIVPKGSYDIMNILMSDSAHIMGKDTETLSKKADKYLEPIYTQDDVDNCLQHIQEYDFDEKHIYDDEFTFRFVGSGHIINAAQIEMWITSGTNTKKILYTSDLGSTLPKHYATKFKAVDKANLVIGEATYANGRRCATAKDRKTDLEKIKSVINEVCICNKAKVLIPVFALDRCQNILTVLYEMFKDDENCPNILIDSPMACKITKLFASLVSGEEKELYSKVLTWDKVKLIEDYETSKVYQESKEPLVCLSCSGMLVSGRSVAWARKLLGNPKNCLLFVGYSADNSLASKIKMGKHKTITIENKAIPNKAIIVDLKSFSSHLQHDGLLEYYSNINADKIALVHSNFNEKLTFAEELQAEISKKNKTSKVICVNRSTEIVL